MHTASNLSSIAFFLSNLVLSTSADTATNPPATPKLNFGSFSNRTTYIIAAELGYFKDAGVRVNQSNVAGSISAYKDLLDGELDVLEGTVDNILDKRFNSRQKFSVIAETDQGDGLTLFSSDDIKTPEQFRGKTLLVDSPASGYVLLARRILALYGLQYPADYSFAVSPVLSPLPLTPKTH